MAVWGILLPQQLQPPLHPASWCTHVGVRGTEHISQARGTVCTSGAPETTSQEPGRVRITKGPAHAHAPIAPRRVSA